MFKHWQLYTLYWSKERNWLPLNYFLCNVFINDTHLSDWPSITNASYTTGINIYVITGMYVAKKLAIPVFKYC